MTAWPKDNQTARNAFYGDPGKGQIASQIVPVVPPFAMYYDGKRVKAIQCHRRAAPALQEIWDYCQHDQAKIDAAGVSKYAGAYNHRMGRRSKTKWSNHAYAAAIDLNAGENALGVAKAPCHRSWWMPSAVRVPCGAAGTAPGRTGCILNSSTTAAGSLSCRGRCSARYFGCSTISRSRRKINLKMVRSRCPSSTRRRSPGTSTATRNCSPVKKRLRAMNYNPGVQNGV
jgi:hypothetical protein